MPASWIIGQWIFLHLNVKKINYSFARLKVLETYSGYISCILFITCALGSNSMEAYSYIPLDIKECENSNTNVNKAFIVQLQNSSLQSHWKCRTCITIWPRHIFSKFASVNSILSCVKNLSHTEYILQTEVKKITSLSWTLNYSLYYPELYQWSVNYFTLITNVAIFFTVLNHYVYLLQIPIDLW